MKKKKKRSVKAYNSSTSRRFKFPKQAKRHFFGRVVGFAFKVIQPWLSQFIMRRVPSCICNYHEQVHHSATSRRSWRFNLEMLPRILTPLITTASSTFNRTVETLDLRAKKSTQLLQLSFRGEHRWGRTLEKEEVSKFSSGVEVVVIAGEDSLRVDAQQEKLGLVKMRMEDHKLRYITFVKLQRSLQHEIFHFDILFYCTYWPVQTYLSHYDMFNGLV